MLGILIFVCKIGLMCRITVASLNWITIGSYHRQPVILAINRTYRSSNQRKISEYFSAIKCIWKCLFNGGHCCSWLSVLGAANNVVPRPFRHKTHSSCAQKHSCSRYLKFGASYVYHLLFNIHRICNWGTLYSIVYVGSE